MCPLVSICSGGLRARYKVACSHCSWKNVFLHQIVDRRWSRARCKSLRPRVKHSLCVCDDEDSTLSSPSHRGLLCPTERDPPPRNLPSSLWKGSCFRGGQNLAGELTSLVGLVGRFVARWAKHAQHVRSTRVLPG